MENNIDKQVDETLEKCILVSPRKSFFLFAGAGSGKTYSLVLLLKKIKDSIGQDLLLQGKQVAVITFTNAATDEIINRLDYSPVFHISTIHSFVWDVIKYYQTDIKFKPQIPNITALWLELHSYFESTTLIKFIRW